MRMAAPRWGWPFTALPPKRTCSLTPKITAKYGESLRTGRHLLPRQQAGEHGKGREMKAGPPGHACPLRTMSVFMPVKWS